MLSAEQLQSLAGQQVLIGTSSWKYPGWCGQLYDEQRYLTRAKFSEAKFERECLTEYAQTCSAWKNRAAGKATKADHHAALGFGCAPRP